MRRIITKSDFVKGVIVEEVSVSDAKTPTNNLKIDNYSDKLLKLIPAEVITAFIAVNSILSGENSTVTNQLIHWISFVILVFVTPFYLKKITKKTLKVRKDQLVISTFTFVVWAFAFGGPFEYLTWYTESVSGVSLVIWTVIAPLLIQDGKKSKNLNVK